MNFYTYTLIGILAVLLKPSQVKADLFQFPDSSCYELKGEKWTDSKACKRNPSSYSLASSPELFCAYTLKKNDTVYSSTKRLRYYRNLKDSVLIEYSSGKIKKINLNFPTVIIFSKRDLLVSNKTLCSPISNIKNPSGVYYLLHKPNSFYVLKSGLRSQNSSKNKDSLKITGNTTNSLITASPGEDEFVKFGYAHSFVVRPRLFYEKIEGKQIANSTSASLSGNLSPGLNLKFTLNEHRNWQYGASVDLDFHIFDERAGEFLLNNNTVQTLAVNIFTNLNLNKKISTMFALSLYEDLYYARTSPSSLGLEKELVPRLTFSTDLILLRQNNLGLKFTPKVFYDFSAGPLSNGYGYSAPVVFEFIRNDQIWSLGVEYFSLQKELSDLELERSALSFFVKTKVFF